MPATELVCFDLDGCLVDSTAAITGSIVAALERLGVSPPPAAELSWCVGPPLRESFVALLSAADDDPGLVEDGIDAYRDIYARTWLERTRVIDGIPEVLDELCASGMRLAVVTSKPHPISGPILEGLGLRGWFEALHAPDADHGAEPKSQTLARALLSLLPETAPSAAAMVGDRSHDIVAGRACGTTTVGVTWGAGDRAELEAAGAQHVVDAPAELTPLFA